MKRVIGWSVILLVLAGLAAAVYSKVEKPAAEAARDGAKPAPVEVQAVERRTLRDIRQFSGTLEARFEFIAAPKISGRLVHLAVDIGDEVQKGQVVARLDEEELKINVTEAQAEVDVAKATLEEVQKSAEVAQREYDRIATLAERRSATEAALDTARLDRDAAQSRVAVAEAQLAQRDAALRAAQVRLSYAEVRANWEEGDATRVAGERFVDEGDTLSANAPIISVLDIDTLRAAFFVTEKDYPRLRIGQQAVIRSDSFPGQAFAAQISRIAPLFQTSSRQARVEAIAPNDGRHLKPGMFVTVEVELQRVDDVPVIPVSALSNRDGRQGVFLLAKENSTVSFVPIQLGIRQGGLAQVIEPAIFTGEVVTLGQHLLKEGAPVLVSDHKTGAMGGNAQ